MYERKDLIMNNFLLPVSRTSNGHFPVPSLMTPAPSKHNKSSPSSLSRRRIRSLSSQSSCLSSSLIVLLCLVNCILCYRQPNPPPHSSSSSVTTINHRHHHQQQQLSRDLSRLTSSTRFTNHQNNQKKNINDHLITSSSDSSEEIFGRRIGSLHADDEEHVSSDRRSDTTSTSEIIEDPTVPIAILGGSDLEYSDTLNGEMKDTDQQVLYINHGDGAVSSIRRSFAGAPAGFSPHVSSYPTSPFDTTDNNKQLIKDSLIKRSDEAGSVGGGGGGGHNSVTGTRSGAASLEDVNGGGLIQPNSGFHPVSNGATSEGRERSNDYDDDSGHLPFDGINLFPDDVPRLFTRRAGQSEGQGNSGHTVIDHRLNIGSDQESFAPPENSFGSSFDDAPTEPPIGSPQTDSPRYNERHSFSIRHPSPSDRPSLLNDRNGNNGNSNNNFSPFFPPNPFLGQAIGNGGGQPVGPESFFNLFNPLANGGAFPPLPQLPPPPPVTGSLPRPTSASFGPKEERNAIERNSDDQLFQRRRLAINNNHDPSVNSINSMYPNYYRGNDVSNSDTINDKWPKIFKFTDGRINLNDFEKDKKMGRVKFSSRDRDFDNVRRDSFLILHGGTYS